MLLFSSVKHICLVLLWWSKLKHVFKTLIGFTYTIKKKERNLKQFQLFCEHSSGCKRNRMKILLIFQVTENTNKTKLKYN
jgi:hypothetical protein